MAQPERSRDDDRGGLGMNSAILIPLVVGYLLGSIPFGLLLTRLAGKGDIRNLGSGNIGATNVLRTGSKGLAALTLILDVAKGALAVWLAQHYWPAGAHAAAGGALVGHLYPPWLKFRGGKGVATLLGVLIALLPIAAMVYAVLWIGLLLLARISSVAGISAAASAPLTAVALGRFDLLPLLGGLAVLVIYRHHENIRRLATGEEPRIGRSAE